MTGNFGSSLLWPFLLYGVAVVFLVGSMLLISHFIGERHAEKATHEPYESGIEATSDARLRFPNHFYLIAMFFVIFDVAGAFVITWAIAIREVGWPGYVTIFIFSEILFSVLIYLWKIGALDFGPDAKRILKAYHERIKKDKSI
jgi:NADH-quinone oxidoreductase subunit A